MRVDGSMREASIKVHWWCSDIFKWNDFIYKLNSLIDFFKTLIDLIVFFHMKMEFAVYRFLLS